MWSAEPALRPATTLTVSRKGHERSHLKRSDSRRSSPTEGDATPPRAKCPSLLLVATATRGTRIPAALHAGPRSPPAGGRFPPTLSSTAHQRAMDGPTLRAELLNADSRILWRYNDGPRLVSDAADDESLPPWCDTVPASGPRSLRSDRQPLPLYPGRDMSIHTLKGVARDDALL